MSPPDPDKRLPNQRFPILTFAITVPKPAHDHNAHRVAGQTYYWRFTEQIEKPDSVWIQWAADPGS